MTTRSQPPSSTVSRGLSARLVSVFRTAPKRLVLCLSLILGFTPSIVRAAPLERLLHEAGIIPLLPPAPAPDFQLFTTTRRPLRLRTQRGKVVLLNFWATWCPPCVREMPVMDKLSRALRAQPFVLWGINMQENPEQIIPFLERYHLRFPVLLDRDGEVSMLYMVHSIPMTYVINCAGHLVGQATGVRQWDGDRLRRLFTSLFRDHRCLRTHPR